MKNRYDANDAILPPIFAIASAAVVGIADVELFSWALSDEAFAVSGVSVSTAALVGFIALAAAYVTNETDLDKLDEEYYYAAIATPVLMGAVVVSDTLLDWIVSTNDVVAILFVAVTGAGYAAISYFA